MAKLTANRYRPEGKKFDRIHVITDAMFRGSWLGPTHTFKALGLMEEGELAHECNKAPPCGPEDSMWKYEFEIRPVERD